MKVDAPTAGLSEDKGGSMSDANFEANIGSGFLKRFVVTFDYAHQRMWLKPIVPAPIDAGRFDRSGMWINADKGGYEVTAVSAGGPAEQAGLKAGDVIVALDGQPAVAEKLSDARIMLRARPAGSQIEAKVKRDGAERTVNITLRDQI
jgi:S1-C subfamily serine protease